MFGTDWKRWNWLDIVAVPLAAALMRVAWVYPLLAVLTHPAVTASAPVHVPAWLLVALTFGGTMLTYLASETREGVVVAALTGFSACLAVLLATFPPGGAGLSGWMARMIEQITHWGDGLPAPVVLLVVTALLWWRGMATQGMDHGALARAFTTGAVAMALTLILIRVFPPFLSTGQLVACLVVYLVSGLAMLALAGASQALRRSSEETGLTLQLSRNWLITVLGVIAAVLLVGWIVSLIIAPQSVLEVIRWLRPLWRLLGQLVYYILYPFVWLLFMLLMPLLRWLSSLFNRGQPQEVEATPQPTPEPLEQIEQATRRMPPAFDFFLRVVILVGIILLFVWLLALALRRRRPLKRRNGVVEVRESLLSWDLVRQQLAALFNRPRREPPPPLFDPLAGDPADPRLTIRQAYRRLIALAVERGYPRARRQTPLRYLGRLREMAPGQDQPLQALTETYTAARYDPDEPSPAQAELARRALGQIEATLGAAAPEKQPQEKDPSGGEDS